MARKKKKKVKVNTGCLVSVVVLVISAVVLFVTPLFDIYDIAISGNSRISKAEILIASDIRKDKNIFAINKAHAKEKIMALGYIENVKITRRLPHTVNIEVKEGAVVAFLESGDEFIGINKEGLALCRVSKAQEGLGAPVVKGVGIDSAQVGEKIGITEGRDDEYEVLLKLMNSFEVYGISGNITQIDVTRKDDIAFRHMDKLKIEFGGLNDYELKFNYLDAMLKELGADAAGVINMQAENYVYRNTVE